MDKPKDPDRVLKETVEKTIEAVADYVEPGPRSAEGTVQKVIETVDNAEVKQALKGFEDKRERAIQTAQQDSFEKHERRMSQKEKGKG